MTEVQPTSTEVDLRCYESLMTAAQPTSPEVDLTCHERLPVPGETLYHRPLSPWSDELAALAQLYPLEVDQRITVDPTPRLRWKWMPDLSLYSLIEQEPPLRAVAKAKRRRLLYRSEFRPTIRKHAWSSDFSPILGVHLH